MSKHEFQGQRTATDGISLREYFEALRSADQRALQIKETADERALLLRAETQKYKDEKANDLRSQIERERGLFATKDDLAALADKFDALHRPVVEFMASQAAKGSANLYWLTTLIAIAGVMAYLIGRFA